MTKKNTQIVQLSKPITNGANKITELTLREPLAGDLRGVKLVDFLSIDIDSIAKVLPRIATPIITEPEVYKMPLADISGIMEVVAGFLTQNSNNAPTESPIE